MQTNSNIDCVIGIDPGSNGAITVWAANGGVKVYRMPKNGDSFVKEVKNIMTAETQDRVAVAFLEKIQTFSADREGGKFFNLDKLKENYTTMRVLLEDIGVPFALVHPMKWQSAMSLRGAKDEDKRDRKNRYKRVAARMFPSVKVTLWNADALLILAFGRKMLQENMNWVVSVIPSSLHDKML